MTETGAAPQGEGADRIAGGALIAAAALSVLAMAHHPTGAHGGAGMAGFIHGAMIVLLTVTTFGFAQASSSPSRRIEALDAWRRRARSTATRSAKSWWRNMPPSAPR